MAARRQFSLAIPALASILMGLKETQSALGERLHETPIFLFIFSAVGLQKNLAPIKQPLALLGWPNMLAWGQQNISMNLNLLLFFRKPKRIISPALIPTAKVIVLHDDGNLSILKSDFFICIRFGYLTLCYDDTNIIEPYCPKRLSRQFGLCQHIPHAPKCKLERYISTLT